MRFNPKYKINKVAGEYILLDTTVDSVNMNKVFAMNEPAAWLWKKSENPSLICRIVYSWCVMNMR